jgi:hypothetical protein
VHSRPRVRFGALIATIAISAGAVFGGATAAYADDTVSPDPAAVPPIADAPTVDPVPAPAATTPPQEPAAPQLSAIPQFDLPVVPIQLPIPQVTITFDPNGGLFTNAPYLGRSATIALGTTVTAPTDVARLGSVFAGWWTAPSGGTQLVPGAYVFASTTYYAHWRPPVSPSLIASIPSGQVGVPFPATNVIAAGDDTTITSLATTFAVPGLTLSSSGAITGTPTADGSYVVLVTAASADIFTVPASRIYTITIAPGTLTAGTPAIAGVPTPGQTLTASTGTWTPSGAAFGEQWLLDGTAIAGETHSTYVVRSGDVGHTVSVRVTASLAHYTSASATSAGSLVGIPPVVPAAQTHDGQAGSTYSFDVAGLRSGGAATSVSITGGALPHGLSMSSAGLISGTPDVAGSFSVDVAFANAWGSSTVTVSMAIAPLDGSPTISGNPAVGETLAAVPGTWVPTPTSFAYQWYRGLNAIPASKGGTASTYAVQPVDAGKLLSVRVTANGRSATSPQVEAGVAPVMPATASFSGQVTAAFSESAAVSQGTKPSYAVTSGSLPDGIHLKKSNGDLTGTPTQAGTGQVTITATNAWGSASVVVSFDIATGPLAHLNLKPGTVSTTAGASTSFLIVGRDAAHETTPFAAPTVTSDDASSTIGAVSAVPGQVGAYTVDAVFTAAGTHHLTATSGAFADTSTVSVDPAAVSALVVTPSATSVAQGGSLTFTAMSADAYGNEVADVTSQIVLTSDWDVDVISGTTVTFPHASPHVITATLAGSQGAVVGSVTVQVIPAVAAAAAVTPVTPAATGSSVLASTGVDAAGPVTVGLVALLFGGIAVAVGALRRRARR